MGCQQSDQNHAERIKHLLIDLDITPAEIGRRLKISPAVIRNTLFSKTRKPGTRKAIARFLGLELTAIWEDAGKYKTGQERRLEDAEQKAAHLRDLRDQGKTLQAIADELGISKQAVHQYISIDSARAHRIKVKLREKGFSLTDVAQIAHVSPTTVSQVLARRQASRHVDRALTALLGAGFDKTPDIAAKVA